MADLEEKFEDNVKGAYYVDRKCILCSACAEIAPGNFKESEDGDHDVVYKQPENEREALECEEALSACPVEAIGNDGPA